MELKVNPVNISEMCQPGNLTLLSRADSLVVLDSPLFPPFLGLETTFIQGNARMQDLCSPIGIISLACASTRVPTELSAKGLSPYWDTLGIGESTMVECNLIRLTSICPSACNL